MTGKKLAVAYTCCVAGCKDPVSKQGLCVEHREQLSMRAGVFGRTAPPPKPTPPPKSRVKTGEPPPGAPPLRR